jgi:hypothetical protein
VSSSISLLMSWSGPKCRHQSQQIVLLQLFLLWKFCLSGCCLDTDLCNRYLGIYWVTYGRFPWKAPTSSPRCEAYERTDMASGAFSLGRWYVRRCCCWSSGGNRFVGVWRHRFTPYQCSGSGWCCFWSAHLNSSKHVVILMWEDLYAIPLHGTKFESC